MPLPYYRLNAQAYANATREVNMSALHARFLLYVPEGSLILDAGCGSGRDTFAFLQKGYRVEAFDACPELAQLASQHTGISVDTRSFVELKASNRYDAIWACASLLHVPELEQTLAWAKLWSALKPGGLVYASYKLGLSSRFDEQGRPFTDANERRLAKWTAPLPDAEKVEAWLTCDQRAELSQHWLNVLVHRKPL